MRTPVQQYEALRRQCLAVGNLHPDATEGCFEALKHTMEGALTLAMARLLDDLMLGGGDTGTPLSDPLIGGKTTEHWRKWAGKKPSFYLNTFDGVEPLPDSNNMLGLIHDLLDAVEKVDMGTPMSARGEPEAKPNCSECAEHAAALAANKQWQADVAKGRGVLHMGVLSEEDMAQLRPPQGVYVVTACTESEQTPGPKEAEAGERNRLNARKELKDYQEPGNYKLWYDDAMCASNEAGYVGLDAASTIREMAETIAKKDAALQACIEALEAAEDECAKPVSTTVRHAITQAKEAMGEPPEGPEFDYTERIPYGY